MIQANDINGIWKKYYSRKYNIQRHEVVLRALEHEFFRQYYKLVRFKVIIIPEQGNEDFYYEKKHWGKFVENLAEVTSKNLETFNRFCSIFLRNGKEFVRICKDIYKKDLGKLSNNELAVLYSSYHEKYLGFFASSIWVPFVVEPEITKNVEKELKKLSKEEYLKAVLSPDKENVAVKERIDLLKLALGKGNLKEHLKKYLWIPCYDIDDKPWDIAHFKSELEIIKNPEKELEEIKDRALQTKRLFSKLLTDPCLNNKQKELFQMGKLNAYLKDKRDEHRREGQYYVQSLYTEIGRRFGLSLKQVTYLTRDEILNMLKKGLKVDEEKINERMGGYVYIWKYGEHKLYSGKEAQDIVKKEFPAKIEEDAEEIDGLSANTGNVKGKAKIIINKNDLHKVKEGDILVAVSTHPDYVPAMRKAAAVVTDEGGLTCHAAIIARELNIPCIVGTKIATRVLKDGMLVDVNASRGKIKKLK